MFRFFEKLVDPYQPYTPRPVPPRKLWPFLRMYLSAFDHLFVIALIFSVLVAMIEISLIWYLGRLVDILAHADPGTFWTMHGVEMILVAIGVLVVRPGLQLIDVLILNNALLPNIGTLVRYRAHKHVVGQSIGWFENDFAGRIANRIMQTPPATGEVVFQVLDALSFAFAYLIGAYLLLLTTDAQLVVPLFVWTVLFFMLIFWTVRRVGPASKASSDARSKVTGRVVDSYTNIHSVKMFDHHDGEIEYVKESIEHSRVTFQAEMRLFTTMDIGLVTLNGFLIIGVVGWAIYLWTTGASEVGIVAAAAALTLRLNGMSGWIMWATSSFFRELGVISEGMETIAAPIELLDAPKATALNFDKGLIQMQGVSHHYGKASGGLDNVNLTIKPGERVGLVGPSGAGKSTLIKLLLRFYDAEEGDILLDGQNVRNVTQASLRQHIGVVQQDNALLHRSVEDNILFGKPDASLSDVRVATDNAVATDFIKDLEDGEGRKGMDALVGERGVKLSGGQRQRIALARVLLKNAPILILDEATAALDSDVEAKIQDALYSYMKDKTVLAIAHRLSTIAQMDRIIVMDQGRIVEQGTHDDLIAEDGIYAGLWARQSGGFLISDDDA